MSLFKYITVYDDERNKVLKVDICNEYNISAYPSFYIADGKPYYDGINTGVDLFCEQKADNIEMTPVTIPHKVFLYAYDKAFDSGALAVFVLCPHFRFTPYYKEAKKAAQMFMRHKKVKGEDFKIFVLNTKTFAAGMQIAALSISNDIANEHRPSGVVAYYAKEKYKNSKTLILNQDDVTGDFSAIKIVGNNVTQMDITNSVDNVKFDKFSEYAAKEIKNKRYAISIGGKCTFAGNIIGRIETISNKLPLTVMQYGIPTTDIFGPRALCIHIL